MNITIERTDLDDVKIVVPDVFADDRGWFTEVFRRDVFEAEGLPATFVQLNHSSSIENVVRGLHFQWDPPMGKLMRVTAGLAFLVAVDIRVGSPTLGRWVGVDVSAENHRQVWAPAGFARGFCALSGLVEVEYLCTGTYNGAAESAIKWNDAEIGVAWPVAAPIVSLKDDQAPSFRDWLAQPEALNFRYVALASEALA